MERDRLKICETFREDQKAEDNLRRIQRPRIRYEENGFVLMLGDEELERCDDLMDAVGKQIAYTYGTQEKRENEG